MNRSKFIKLSALGIATTISGPELWAGHFFANTSSKNQLFNELLENNDKRVENLLSFDSERTRMRSARSLAGEFSAITASYCVEESEHYKSDAALKRLEELTGSLIELQYQDGTVDSGGRSAIPA